MELNACIKGRRSIRLYQDKSAPKEIVEKILNAGIWAPSGMNSQPWRFVVIENRDIINKLSKRTKEILSKMPWPTDILQKYAKSEKDTIFYDAPLLILLCVPKKEEWRQVNILDCGLAAQNMFLTAYQEGLGSCFIGFGWYLNRDPAFLADLGVPADHEVIAPMIFGYPAEDPKPKSRELRILKWIS
ncbi:MAG: nitroreductase family protein [Methanotrichaceae archaeon]|nr:nitroreductase family protein [Methanotrichaceae archaeon]